MNISCNVCENGLSEPGALFFSPPNKKGNVKKLHICGSCYAAISLFIALYRMDRRYFK